MRRTLLLAAVLCAAIVACSGPNAVPEEQALFTDADLDSAEALSQFAELDLSSAAAAPDSTGLLAQADARTRSLDALGIEALHNNKNKTGFSAGGYLVYSEQKGREHTIHLVTLDEDSEAGRKGDRVIYKGKKPIQSVSVSGDGSWVAFVAPGVGGQDDVYVLDIKGRKASFTATAAAESDVSMSLDGRFLAWQSETRHGNSIVWYDLEFGGVAIDPLIFEAIFGAPLTFVQPSLSGNGQTIALVETSGALATLIGAPAFPTIAALSFEMTPGGQASLGLAVIYLGDVANPSFDFDAGLLLFQEEFGGQHFVSLIDRGAGALVDLLAAEVDHPYLTADGDYFTFSFDGNAYVASVAGSFQALSPSGNTRDSGTYWARGNFTAYEGSNDRGPFVRADSGDGIDAAGRTVGYHAFPFTAPVTAFYEILSIQDYDGFLTLYERDFNPNRPERNVVANNDDFLHSWDGVEGISRIVAELRKNTKYVIVTSACGAPGSPCGPSSGSFQNLITGGVEPPPPPTVLPEPDDTRFNITLRFWNDSLTADEQAIFGGAANRWSQVITDDLENIEGFELTEDETTAGAPGIVGVLDDVIIDASKVAIDGPGGTLARAGAFYVRDGGPDDFLPMYGIMEFDEAEFGPGGFFENTAAFSAVILHEMGHVLGISRSFWGPLGLITGNRPAAQGCSNVALGDDPRYTGAQGNAAWHDFYGADTDTVPIENTNGCGTADSHWRELFLDDEVMTGFAAGGSEPLSRVTIGALADLGYGVDFDAADAWSLPILPTLAQVSPNPTDYAVEFDFTLAYTGSTLGLVQAPVTAVGLSLADPATSASGCDAAQFAGFPAGNIALLQRGTCTFFQKAANAFAAGASGVLIGNQGNAPDRLAPAPGTIDPGVDIIAMPISFPLLQELAATPNLVMRVDTRKDDAIRAQALSGIELHIAEEFVPLRGKIDRAGTVTPFDVSD